MIRTVLTHGFVLALAFSFIDAPALAQEAQEELTPQELRERQVMGRFLQLLEKTPRRGTALDRVYGYHVERGTLDDFAESYRKQAQESGDGTAWMILGLVELQRGRDAGAVEALRQAEEAREDDPLASYYLGQAYVLVGQPDKAAEAFERAIERKPERQDLLEIFQALGRVHQRAHRTKEALAVWDRLETLFPGDRGIQEQVATTLAEEGQHEEAMKRFGALAAAAKDDPYRQVSYAMQAADLKVRLRKTDQALVDFEKLLAQLKPESWLYREVRRKIEDVFRRNEDLAGLAEYYEKWIGTHPEDVAAMTRLGQTLASQGRGPEAQEWFEKAVKLAPSNRSLRLALIDQLVQDGEIGTAVARYEELDKVDPNNPDTIREWGALILKDKARPEEERQKAAVQVWNKLLQSRPNDPVIVTQVADLMRDAKLNDEAIRLYKKAVELAPGDPQYREYLGEYYHKLERSDEAIATWKQIAAGKNRTAANLVRLAEVLSGFGYREPAIEAMQEALQLEPKSFNHRVKQAQLLGEVGRHDEALVELEAAAELAETDDEEQMVLQEQIKAYQASETLADRIAELEQELASAKQTTAAQWYRLSTMWDAARQMPEATTAIQKALELDPQSVLIWTRAAQIYERSGNLIDAVAAFKRLATIDRRFRTEHLSRLATLQMRLGQHTEALQSGRDLIDAAPGNPEHYQFFAQLCFQLGREEDGFNALRRAVRVNPADQQALLTLANALAEQFRTAEATELFWQAFDKADGLEGRLSIVSRLSEMHLRTNQLDRLLDRLRRLGREENDKREATILVAQAYHGASDYGSARQELESLLTEDTRDTQLLQQLSSLAEAESDWEAAVKYQERLIEVAPSPEGETRLGQLYVKGGQVDEAEALWQKFAENETETHRLLQAIDSLISHEKYPTALAITDRLIRRDPLNWEVLYREGAALAKQGEHEKAAERFRGLLELRLPDDEKSAQLKALESTTGQKYRAANPRQTAMSQFAPARQRYYAAQQVRQEVGLVQQRQYYSGSQQQSWKPADYGQSRMAAMGWLYAAAQSAGKEQEEQLLAEWRPADQEDPDPRAAWDWLYLQVVRSDQREMYEAARRLPYETDPEAAWISLIMLSGRTAGTTQNYQPQPGQADTVPPLGEGELAGVMTAYQTLQTQRPEWVDLQVSRNITLELRRAGRDKERQEVYEAALAAAQQPSQVIQLMYLAGEDGNFEGMLSLFDRLEQVRGNSPSAGALLPHTHYLVPMLTKLFEEDRRADALRLIDRYHDSFQKLRDGSPQYLRQLSQSGRSGPMHISIRVGNSYRGVQIDYPQPNTWLPQTSIELLRNVYELFKQKELTGELTAHFQRQAEKAAGPQAITARLLLSALHWWNEDKSAATDEMALAVAAGAEEVELKLQLAGLKQQLGDTAGALAIIESVEPLDQDAMRQRELLALNLSVLGGNVPRARKAAERLFGLRLDTNIEIQLAGQMHQLGMHELAQAVLSRTRRRAGNQTSVLVSLMQQYQRQGDNDTAAQIAHHIIRKTLSGASQQQYYGGGRTQDDVARDQAVQMLARAGNLDEITGRIEKQIERSPNSVQLHQTLAAYYTAAGNKEKAKDVYDRLIELRPKDARLRYQLGQQQASGGDHKGAVDHYLAALREDPALLQRDFYQLQQTFQRADRMDDLVKLLDEIDLRKIGQYHYVSNLIHNLVQNEKTREQGFSLFRRAWDAFEDQRVYLLSNYYHEELWKLPEIYDYLREAIIPKKDKPVTDPWQGIGQIMSWSGDGQATGMLTRIVATAESQSKLDPLSGEVEAALEHTPGWLGGKALLAVLRARQGKTEEAEKLIEELLSDEKSPLQMQTGWLIGQELEKTEALKPLAVRLYETGTEAAFKENQNGFSYSPLIRLVRLYGETKRNDEARALLLRAAKAPPQADNYNPGYSDYRKLNDIRTIAAELTKIEYPFDAVRLYNEALADRQRLSASERWGGSMKQQLERGLKEAQEKLNPETYARTLLKLTDPEELAARPENEPAIDLIVMVQPSDLESARVISLFHTAVESVATQRPPVIAEARENVALLKQKRPDDFSVVLADAMLALEQESTAADKQKAIASLRSVIADAPLSELPEGEDATSQQRDAAAKHLGLWIIAREAWAHDETRELADELAAQAMDAARRQSDSLWTLAMLRERGAQALEQGDRDGAEAHWTRMLDLILNEGKPKAQAAADAEKSTSQRGSIPVPAPHPVPRPKPIPAAEPKPAPKAQPPKRAVSASGPLSPRERVRVRVDDRSHATNFSGSQGANELADFLKTANAADALPSPRPSPKGRGGRRRAVESSVEETIRAAAVLASFRTGAEFLIPSAAFSQAYAIEVPAFTPVTTEERFLRAMQVAKLAAEHDMPALSLRAVRESLAGGPPLKPITDGNARSGAFASGIVTTESGPNTQIDQQVEERLFDLDQLWRKHQVPAGDVYQALVEVVLPPGRPTEVFLYPRPLAQSGVQTPRSAANLLVRWAIDAGEVDDLIARIEPRLEQPLGAPAAEILLARIAVMRGDAAETNRLLAQIGQRLKTAPLQHTAELACNIAVPALERRETAEAAVPVIEQAVQVFGESSGEEPVASLLKALSRYHFERKDPKSGKERLDQYLKLLDAQNSRYGGDYGLYRRKQQLQTVARELIRAGELEGAFTALGEYEDIKLTERYGSLSLGNVAGPLSRHLARQTPQERFELLTAWMLPDGSQTLRSLTAWIPETAPPPVFARALDEEPDASSFQLLETGPTPGLFSSAEALVDAARDVGALDALAARVGPRAEADVEHAKTLQLLVRIAQDPAAAKPEVEARLEEVRKLASDQNDGNKPFDPWQFVVARAAISDPVLTQTGIEMLQALVTHTQRLQANSVRPHIRRALAAAMHGTKSDRTADLFERPNLALWQPANQVTADATEDVQPLWLAHSGYINHVAGPMFDHLVFNYPLTGSFEFSADVWDGGWSEGDVGYGGLVYEALGFNRAGSVFTVGRSGRLSKPAPFVRREAFNRHTIEARPGLLRFLVNGHLYHEEKEPSATSPWLTLYADRGRNSLFRNLTITGNPEIPREVRLIEGDRMAGWVSSFYSQRQPAGIGDPTLVYSGGGIANIGEQNPMEIDWETKSGVMTGRRAASAGPAATTESRLYYHRPLREGETLSYEFFYAPDETMVHPALGRVAFIVEVDGVKLHWMTGGPENEWTGLSSDNVVTVPEEQMGAGPLPLVSGDWNTAAVHLENGMAVLTLNGTQVYRHELDAANDRLFGFFHWKDRSAVQVRNVVLTGNWPQALTAEQMADLAEPSRNDLSTGDYQFMTDLFDESRISYGVLDVVRRTEELDDEARLSLLKDYVLPNNRHWHFRLHADFTPTNPAPGPISIPAAHAGSAGEAKEERRAQTGGDLVSPALMLVDTAVALGQIDELYSHIEALEAHDNPARDRARRALLAVTDTARGNFEGARQHLEALVPLLEAIPEDQPMAERWAGLIAVVRAVDNPELHAVAGQVLNVIVTHEQRRGVSEIWYRQIRHCQARLWEAQRPIEERRSWGTDPGLALWSPVTKTSARYRGEGRPRPHWTVTGGELIHRPGHHHDYMYFNVPLQGDFELQCELRAFGWRETYVNYAGYLVGPRYDLKRLEHIEFGRSLPNIPVDPPLKPIGATYDYRLVVKDGKATHFVNGDKFYERHLPANPDPWIALWTNAFNDGGAGKLRITGSASVPEQLELSAAPTLISWQSSYYDESIDGSRDAAGNLIAGSAETDVDWRKDGEAIVGRKVPELAGSGRESVLQYHRPLLEDGEIEYEFFYQPGETLVHPAIDRLAFLLEPDGVKIHWMTDAEYERTGLSPFNVSEEPKNRRGPDKLPLSAGEWNRVKLALTGDTATLTLNGEEVYRRHVEPSNQRTFGLFHYKGESEVRVRNVTYRGDWPKTLPGAEQIDFGAIGE